MTTTRPGRWPTDVLATLGVLGLVAVAVLALRTRSVDVVAASALPAAFLVAGLVGGRARPDHPGVRLLLAVGTAHLVAFAATGWVGLARHPSGWLTWVTALAGDAAFLAGFVALALLVASYPTGRLDGRALRWLAGAGCSFAVLALVVETTLHARLGLALGSTVESVPVPEAIRLGASQLSLVGFTPALVAVGFVILLLRARRLPEPERAALGWATLAAGALVLMLAATPAANRLLPAAVWDVAFVVVGSLVPFTLLAGLVRYRLLRVDVYVVRTLARGVVAVVVLAAYAIAAAVLQDRYRLVAAVVLTVAAALTGMPLVHRLQTLADRWLTGGRVASRTVLDQLTSAIVVPDPDTLGQRICRSVADGLEVGWVRLVVHGVPRATAGSPDGAPEVTVALRSGGADVGALECGPRRGGWSRTERSELATIATPVALALRDAELTTELTERVEELTASRARLAEAEQTVRRQVERDLHDGAQQQLVALLARLGVARALLGDGGAAAGALTAAHDLAQQCLRELRDLVTGLHPAVLGAQGLTGAVESRAALLPIPVVVDADPRITDVRFAADVESAAFFVVSEALANVLKHSGSDRARVVLAPLAGGGLRVAVSDEGAGTATFDGSGLVGLRARVEALGGRFLLHATPAVGTTVVAEFDAPVEAGAGAVVAGV